MTTKERKSQQKRAYEFIKDIRTRIAKGKPTTFAERNILKIYEKKLKKKVMSV